MTEKIETLADLLAYKERLERKLEQLQADKEEHEQYKNFKADTFSYEQYEAKQRRIAAEYEASQKGKKYPPAQMTFEELVYYLIKEGESPVDWCILGHELVAGYDGYVVRYGKDKQGFDIYYMERGQNKFLGHCKNEHAACVAMLKLFAKDGNQRLKQYIR